MRKERESLLVAALAGLVIVGVAAFVVQPGLGHAPYSRAQVSQNAVLQAILPAPTREG